MSDLIALQLLLFFFLGFCGASALAAAVYRLLSVYNLQGKMQAPLGILAIVGLHLAVSVPLQVVAAFVIDEISDQGPIKTRIYQVR
jgi:hypothetical protein